MGQCIPSCTVVEVVVPFFYAQKFSTKCAHYSTSATVIQCSERNSLTALAFLTRFQNTPCDKIPFMFLSTLTVNIISIINKGFYSMCGYQLKVFHGERSSPAFGVRTIVY